MKTFIHDMKVLKYHKEDEVKSIILFNIWAVISIVIGKLLQHYIATKPLVDPLLFLWVIPISLLITLIIYGLRYFGIDRKMLREFDKEFDAELKWKNLLRDFNKKDRL